MIAPALGGCGGCAIAWWVVTSEGTRCITLGLCPLEGPQIDPLVLAGRALARHQPYLEPPGARGSASARSTVRRWQQASEWERMQRVADDALAAWREEMMRAFGAARGRAAVVAAVEQMAGELAEDAARRRGEYHPSEVGQRRRRR